MLRKIYGALILTVLIFAIVFFGRGILSSAFADVTVKLNAYKNHETKKLDSEFRILKEKYEKSMIGITNNQNIVEENEKLKKLLALKYHTDIPTVAARVISFGNNLDYRYFIADCGTDDGVYPGNCVISENGYVGEVTECGKNWCGIKTLESDEVRISVTCLENGKTYLLTGGKPHLSLISRNDILLPGDEIVTSGLSDTVPKGLKIGRVLKVTESSGAENNATVSCFEDYENLTYILICPGGDLSE